MTPITNTNTMIAMTAERTSRSEIYLTREEALAGWYRFWSKNEVDFFLKDKYGKNILDEDGNCIAVRKNIPRVLRDKNQINFKNEAL